ncbi:MAG: hypothetical protein P8Z49_11680 [Acidobacteriota bacterium]|jgi:hypothetical protein
MHFHLTPGSLLVSLLVSTVGWGIYRYGRKAGRGPQVIGGILLMIFPYFIGSILWILVISVLACAVIWWLVRVGY